MHINSLESLYSYFKRVSARTFSSNKWVDHGHPDLIKTHKGRSGLVFDKHFECVIPDLQLEFLLESQGIMDCDYSAYLDPGSNPENPGYFTHKVCCVHNTHELTSDDISSLTESFYPNIKGGHWNPYIRYSSSRVCGSQQCHKLLDLVGVDLKGSYGDIGPKDLFFPGDNKPVSKFDHDIVFNSLVLSYPSEIDRLLLSEKYRSRSTYKISRNGKKSSKKDIRHFDIIDRCHRCYKDFFNRLSSYFGLDHDNVASDQLLGSISRLHLWSSEIPLMPNIHHHALIPHFSYGKLSDHDRRVLDNEILYYFNEFSDMDPFICDITLENKGLIKRRSVKQDHGSLSVKSSHITESYPSNRFVLDQVRYDQFREFVSKFLSNWLEFQPLNWANKNSPLNVEEIRDLWSDCVFSEFHDILGDRGSRSCDIFVEFIPVKNKSKLLHALQYATRPPVGDLDLFFKKCSGVVNGYDPSDLDMSVAVSYIQSLFVNAALDDNIRLTKKYDSMLDKIQGLVQDHSKNDFFSWLQFLSVWSTETRISGFWFYLSRYMIDPDRRFSVIEDICPVCGDYINSVDRVSYPVVDHVVIRGRRKFLLVDLWDPPPDPGPSVVYCSHCHNLVGYPSDVGVGGYCPECLELSMFVKKSEL